MTPTFDPEFDPRAVNILSHRAARTYRAMEWLTGRTPDWPSHIEAMTEEEIAEGEALGKGHGLYITPDAVVKLNPRMDAEALYLNFIHENLHHILPEASDAEINAVLVPAVYEEVLGRPIARRDAEEAGV